MKKTIFVTLSIAIITLLVVVPSCKKDTPLSPPSSSGTPDVSSIFEVTNGTFNPASFPEATSNIPLSNVVVNDNVLAGGSSYVTFETAATVNKILVGIQDLSGYYEITPSTNMRDITYEFIMIMSQTLTDSSFVIQMAILDENGDVSEIYSHTVELVTAGTGQLQISLSFDNAKDIDLHLIEPNGTHIYYGYPMSENGGELDVDSNPGCMIDSINNENIFYSDSAYIEPGLYKVYVDMWENCDPSIATNFVLSVFYDGALIETLVGENPAAGTFPVGEADNYGNIDQLEPVIEFEIVDVLAKNKVRNFEPRPLSESAKLKLSMTN